MPDHTPVTDESPQQLVSRAIDQSRRLAQAEVELAKDELHRDARQALQASALLGTGALLALGGSLLLAVALGLRLASARGALLLGLGLGGAGATLAWQGARRFPRHPLAETGEQLRQDLEVLRPALS
ncbi:phage holin family protein [Corallococcus sp. RDP092CA]|uniref:phage holin family protein n=1 Tax=Corallococcus sp. RDP092CA TaxID=3109369 RepID=UPI0035B032D4